MNFAKKLTTALLALALLATNVGAMESKAPKMPTAPLQRQINAQEIKVSAQKTAQTDLAIDSYRTHKDLKAFLYDLLTTMPMDLIIIIVGYDSYELKGFCADILRGHTENVLRLVALDDGQRFASCANDKAIKIWDPSLQKNQCVRTFSENKHSVNSLALHPNKQLAAGLDNGVIKLWDVKTGDCMGRLEGPKAPVYCITPLDRDHLAAGYGKRSIGIWDLKTSQCVKKLKQHALPVQCVLPTTNGQLISCSDDQTIKTWNPDADETKACSKTIIQPEGSSTCIIFLSPTIIATDSSNATRNVIKIWDLPSGKCIKNLKGHEGTVNCLALLTNGLLASGSEDGDIKLWDVAQGVCVKTIDNASPFLESPVRCLIVLSNGQLIAGLGNGNIIVWS